MLQLIQQWISTTAILEFHYLLNIVTLPQCLALLVVVTIQVREVVLALDEILEIDE